AFLDLGDAAVGVGAREDDVALADLVELRVGAGRQVVNGADDVERGRGDAVLDSLGAVGGDGDGVVDRIAVQVHRAGPDRGGADAGDVDPVAAGVGGLEHLGQAELVEDDISGVAVARVHGDALQAAARGQAAGAVHPALGVVLGDVHEPAVADVDRVRVVGV